MKYVLALLLVCSLAASAKEVPTTVVWPSEQNPVLKFTFGKFNKLASYASESSYTVDVTAENLGSKPIPNITLDAYFFNKNNVRIGNGYMTLNNVGLRESVKFTLSFSTTDEKPATLKIVAAAPKQVRLTVSTVPAGAKLKVDGKDAGVTPRQVELTVGHHTLTFSQDGYHNGSFPLDIGQNDVSGGTVNFELGALAHDTVEMWDGTTLTGDVESMDATSVVVRVGGNLQSINRNQVKRILLVQREAPVPAAAPAQAQTVPTT